MSFVRITFLLFMFKLTDGKGFWYNLRLFYKEINKQAIKVKRVMKKVKRCERTLKFLCNCRDNDVFPKFVRWRNIKNQPLKKKNRYYRWILWDEIDGKIKRNNDWIKGIVLKCPLKMVICKEERKWIKTHNKILDGLISHKKEIIGINENPN